MSDVSVLFDQRAILSFAAAATALSGDKLQQALREGLRAAGGKTRTQVRRALRVQINAKAAKDINDRTRSFMPSGALQYVIEATSTPLPIDRIKGLTVNVGPGGGVQAAPWDKSRQFQRSFVVNGKYEARLGKGRFPVRRLYGPSVAKEMVKDHSVYTFQHYAAGELQSQIESRIARFLAM